MTFREAKSAIAAATVMKARDWEWSVYCNHKLPRRALRKARLDVRAAEMLAQRILESKNLLRLPPIVRIEVQRLMNP